MKYIRIIGFLFILLFSLAVQAQDWKLVMDLMVTDEGKKLQGAQISLIQNGNTIQTYTTDSKGQVDVPIPPNGLYILKITAPDLVHKKLEIDTRNVNPEEIGSEEIFYRADVDIFKKIEGLNLSILDEPIGQIWYDDKFGGFTYNKEYTLDKQAALSELKENYLKKKEEEAKRLAKNQKLYENAIKEADKAFKLENWEEAKKYYEEAQALDPTNTYPSFQLGEIASKIIKNKANQEKYDAAIQLADAALASKKFKEAIEQYKRAQGYKPEDGYAAGKIAEVQELAVQAAKVEQNYLAAIEKGDNALAVNDVETAKTAFLEAQKLKPEESYPSSKLDEINSILAKGRQKEEDYNNAIAAAEQSLSSKNYPAAKTSFQQASSIKPNESYPKEKIAEIDGILAEAAKKEQNYLAAITEADNALAAKNYDEAIAAYQNASSIKPSEEYPKEKIKEINSFVAANAEKEKQYEEAIKAADGALAQNNLEAAKTSYNKALQVKPNETYPQQKITEIDQMLAEMAAKEEEYKSAIASADQAYTAKKFETAKGFYETALNSKPQESYPQTKITEINSLLTQQAETEERYNTAIASADQAFQEGNLSNAKGFYEQALQIKPGESYPSGKITEIEGKLAATKQIETDYKAAIESADQFYEAKDFQAAKEAYSNALSIKPGETYPANKITEIENQLQAIADKEKAERLEAERLAKIEADYQAAISKADQLFAEQSWDEASAAYNDAMAIKSNEEYPGKKLEEIKKLKQEQLAQLKQEEVENAYKEAISKADKAFAEKNYELAKSSYKSALEIKAGETYPSEQLAEIASVEKQLAEAEKAQAAEALEKSYQAAIAKADQHFGANEFEAAKKSYSDALAIKANEQYPKDQLEVIDTKIESIQQRQQAEQLAKEKAARLETNYLSAVALADQALENNDYQSAITNYQEALEIKPSEGYPQQKIDEINALLAQKAKNEAEKAAIAEAQQKKDAEYNSFIATAEKELAANNLQAALSAFQSASSVKPNEQYPVSKISEINQMIAQNQAAKEEKEKQNALEAQKNIDYLASVTEADELFENKQWQAAISKYESASAIKPSETYPQQQINEINSRIEKERQQEQEKIEQEREREERERQLAEAAKLKKEQEEKKEELPVNKGPVSQISGETEESIDKMYEEIWEENKTGKESYYAEQKDLVEESKEELRKKDEERKQNAIERLEEITISYSESLKQSTRLNNQNYETVKNNQEQYQNRQNELRIKGQRQREKNWNIRQDQQKGIQENNKETAERNTNLYAQDLKERTENHRENLQQYESTHQKIREENRSKLLEIEEEITNRKEIAEQNTNLYAQDLKERTANHRENLQQYSENQKKVREQRNAEYVSNAKEWSEYKTHLKEKSERENKNKLEDVKQYHQEYSTQNVEYQQKAIASINKQLEGQREFIQHENEQQQASIKVKAEVLKDRKEELSNMEAQRISSSQRRNLENSQLEFYTGTAQPRIDSLASRYPQGTSEEVLESRNGSTTIKRIVVDGSQADVYTKTLHSWGGVFYTKNGRNITEETWNLETE